MVACHGTIRFLRNLKPSRVFCVNCPFLYGNRNTCLKCFHSLPQSKQKRPISQINKRSKKSRISINSENLELDPKVYTRDTITKVSNILRYSTWDSAQEQLGNLKIRWDSFTVNQVLKTHPPMEKAWLFFNWASRLKIFKHDQFTYTTMMDIFGEARRIALMKYVFEQMRVKGIKIDVVTYTSLMHWLSNDGDVDAAVKLWEEMKDKGFSPAVVSYTAYIKILFDHNRVEEGIRVFKEMIESGCPPNCYTYTVLMGHLAGSGKFNEVLEIFNKMQEAGVQPDKATCNILVEKCCKAGEAGTMMKILQYMKENALVLRKPVYMEALETLRIAGKSIALLKQANRHFSIQSENKQRKDCSSPTTDIGSIDRDLVLNFLRREDFVALDRLLANMIEKKVVLDRETMSTIIEAYTAHCRPSGALLAFEYGKEMGIHFEKSSFLSLIGLFIRTNSYLKVVDIVQEMVRGGISLGTNLSALLIYKLGCARKAASASEVFNLLPENEKSTTTHTALIAAYFASKNASEGLEKFKAMREKGIPTALGTYNVLLAGLEKSGRVSELEYYRKVKKRLQMASQSEQGIFLGEMTCNLLFAKEYRVLTRGSTIILYWKLSLAYIYTA